MNITELSVKRPSIIIVIFTILIFFGVYGYQSLTYELLPSISSPVVTVSTIYPGASPNEVETSVTKEIEDAVASIENIDETQGISVESFSSVIVRLNYGTDVDIAMQEVQRKVDAIRSNLPDDIKEPSIGKFSLDELPIIQLGAQSDLDDVEFTHLFKEMIQPEFSRIPGVAQVNVIGGHDREIKVNVNEDKLEFYNISILQITQAIQKSNINFPTGSIKNDERKLTVRLSGKIAGIDELRDIVITSKQDGSKVRLSDIAEIVDDEKEIETISRLNGTPALGITITKQNDGNAVEISEQVTAKIADLEEQYQDINLQFEIANDSSIFTLEAAHHVINDLLLAVVLVALIMLFFLHNIRNAIIVMIAIPVSVISTFAVMSLAGFSLNLMTLLALSLVIGILVDDSIVVLENIHARMEKGATAKEAARSTWKYIGISVLSITLVIIVVFLPIALVSGIVADLLRQFSLVVVAATIISLLVSFTITPWLASRFTKLTHLNSKKIFHWPLIGFEKLIKGIENIYRSIIQFCLRFKIATIVVILGIVFSSFLLMTKGFIGAEFASQGDNGEFLVTLEMSKETPLEENNIVTQEVEAYLNSLPEVVSTFTTVGQSSSRMSTTATPYMTEVNVKLISAEDRALSSNEYARKVKKHISEHIPGVIVSAKPVSMVGGGASAPIQLNLQGPNIDTIMAFSERFMQKMQDINGITELKSTVENGNPEIKVNIDRDKLADLGLSIDIVGGVMQNSFSGNTDAKLQDGNYEYDINVRLDQFDRNSVSDIQNLTFMNNRGQLIKLSQFATVQESTGPARLERMNKMSSLTIESYVIGRDIGSVGEDIRNLIEESELPKGVHIEIAGDLENQEDAFGSLAFALLTSILLVYLIMVALYDNFVYPFVVMFSIPVALIGAFLALALSMENMSIFGMLGLIMLVGLVVKNAILIVDFVNQLKKEGVERKKAVIQGTLERFRPILMTTIAMVIAMIPIAMADGAGSEWKNGLAWVLIGGLTSSMVLTMIIVPVTYTLVDDIGEWFTRKFRKKEITTNQSNDS